MAAGFQAALKEFNMSKIIAAATLVALLSACSSMAGGSMSSSSGMSGQTMGGSGGMGNGKFDSCGSGGGPN